VDSPANSSQQPNGIEKAIDILGDLPAHEQKLLDACLAGLSGNIEKGVNFVLNPPAPAQK
jgi:malate dehydrogenase